MASSPAWSATPFIERYHHSATLLNNRNILICGGVIAGGVVTNGCQISLEDKDDYSAATNMTVARASHTATLLPNGKVLVAGGRNNAGTILATAEVYDPVLNSWSLLLSPMLSVRVNHTATLLDNGKVLVCGGQTAAAGAAATASCDLFDPATSLFAATGAMQAARSAHTATLLRDGRVFMTGGYSPTITPPYLVTTEVFNPATGVFLAANPLIASRAFHSATMLGNGKILIAGGLNGMEFNGNSGILSTTEIYDPLGDNSVPSAPMTARRQSHSASLQSDGTVLLMGGLGNLATSYVKPYDSLLASISSVTGSFAPSNTLSTMNVIGGELNIDLQIPLSVKAGGIIQNGDIYFSCPTVVLPEGQVYFKPGNTSDNSTGLRVDLAGTLVEDGNIIRTAIPVNMGGQYFIPDILVTAEDFNLAAGSGLHLAAGQTPLNATNTPRDVGPMTTLVGTTQFKNMSSRFIGAKISSGIYTITSGQFTQPSSYTLTILLAYAKIPIDLPIVANGQGGAQTDLFTISIGTITGFVEWDGVGSQSIVSHSLPITGAVSRLLSVGGSLKFVTNKLDLDNATFESDTATVVIRSMMFSDVEKYTPNANTWAYTGANIGRRYNHTATLTSDGDIRIHGGRACDPAGINLNCTSQPPVGETSIIPLLSAWTQLPAASNMVNGKRGNHTATLLPDGQILLAGGSNGPSLLDTAEVFNTGTRLFTNVGRMRLARDLHTATLLPNGRVLVAGGFSTTATSTGATNAAEIYYPDAQVWLPTQIMTSTRSNHTATLLPDGNVLLIGGFAYGTYLSSAEIFYSTSATWRAIASMPAPRALHSATLLKDGRVLVVGGLNASPGVLGSALLFNPATNIWTPVNDMANNAVSYSHSATLLQDGRVLVSGGRGPGGELTLSQIYDPAADTWTETAALGGNVLSVGRFGHTTTLLPNGIVALVGGAQSFTGLIRTVETFNVGASTWGSAGKLVSPRSYHTTTLARDGFLYSIGGCDSVNCLATVERTYMGLSTDLNTTGAPPSTRQPVISGVDKPLFDIADSVTSTGLNFHGATEASGGGAGSMNSSHHSPRVVLQRVEEGGGGSSFLVDLTTQVFDTNINGSWALTGSSVTVRMPSSTRELPYGWYHLRMGANAQYSDSVLVQAGPAKPVSPVGNISAAPQSTTTVLWTWSPAAGTFDGYNVYEATTSVLITTRPVPSFLQAGLSPNASSQIQVAPYTLSGDGPVAASGIFYTLANPATGFFISQVKNDSLLLAWSTNFNREGTIYEISQSTDDFQTSISTPVPTSLNIQTTYYTITPLAENTTFSFRIRAFNGAEIPSAFSAIISTRTRSPVSGLQATPQTTSIQWGWLEPGGVINYRVYNATSGVLLGSPVTNIFNDTGLSTNSIRSVQVSAITSAGEGPLSPSVTAYTLAATPLPGAPPVLLPPVLTTGSFVVNWLANGNPPGTTYMAEISSAGFDTGKTTNTTTSLQAGFGELLLPAEIWQIRVKALNGDGVESDPLIIGSTPTLARTPINLIVDNTSPSSIQVSWDKDGNASSATYQLNITTDNFVTNNVAVPFSLGFNGSVATITGLLSSTTYEIRAVARNPAGRETAFSNIVTTRTSNGGAVLLGSLAGVLSNNANSVISGSLGSVPPRTILIQAPSGTFPSDVTLTISSFNVAGNTLCPNPSSIGVQITTDPPMQPNKIVYLTLSYTDAEIGSLPTSQLVLARHEPTAGKCVPLKTTVDTVNKSMTVSLNHFSNFQAVAVAPSAAAETARIFPNPWYAGRVGEVTFHQLPAFAKVRIFTLKGELVNELTANASGLLAWEGLNRGGRRVASGVYLVVFESPQGGKKKILKLAVIQ
jgi:hypothetical protein